MEFYITWVLPEEEEETYNISQDLLSLFLTSPDIKNVDSITGATAGSIQCLKLRDKFNMSRVQWNQFRQSGIRSILKSHTIPI